MNTPQTFTTGYGQAGKFYSLPALEAAGIGKVSKLPVSIRIVLESLVRNFDDSANEKQAEPQNESPAGAESTSPTSPKKSVRAIKSSQTKWGPDWWCVLIEIVLSRLPAVLRPICQLIFALALLYYCRNHPETSGSMFSWLKSMSP